MIPQIQPWIDEKELEQLKRVISSTYVVEHDLTKEFESLTVRLTGVKHAIAMTNGTVALYCGLKALGIGQGDEVIVPDLTFIASANAVIMAGATPVFCDVDEKTFCIDVRKADKLITRNTKAIMPVHLYGQSADMEAVCNFARVHNLKVIEDAAQGVGVKFNGKHVGSFGELGVLSYYGNKTITCGEGGMILTNDDELARKCYKLKNHGRERKGAFVHEDIGFNFSFTEMQAAIGIAQMHKLEQITLRKREIYENYTKGLSEIQDKFKPVFYDPRTQPVFWFTSFLCEEVVELADFLTKNEIQTRRFFYPLHLQPCYSSMQQIRASDYPVSRKIYESGISLPSSYSLSQTEQEYVILKIMKFYADRD